MSYTILTVSILILLEVVLEEDYGFSVDPTTLGFNPYFAGSSSGSSITNIQHLFYIRFNPYFAGSSSGSGIAKRCRLSGSWFQSLFCWK